MWFIKFLSGPLAGKSLPLKSGRNVVGRAPHCEVVIPSQSVSKEHAQIEVYNDKIIITDLNSRNGSFIDGVQIKSHKLQPGERISFFDLICEIKQKSPVALRQKPEARPAQNQDTPPVYAGNVAYDQMPAHQPRVEIASAPAPTANGHSIWSYFLKYLDEVVLPGVYKLPELMEFRSVLGLFVAIFIIFVTALSTVPLLRILKASIEKEAQNRAQTIARSLVRENRNAIMLGQSSLVTTENADREPGVAKAYVIASPNGDILAPPQMAGRYLTDIDFVNEARKTSQESVKQIDDSTVVAVAPVRFNDQRTGSDSTAAHAVVVYNMGALAVDEGRTLSLFIQVLFIAVLIGGLLFFFLYKIVVHPVVTLNQQVDAALRDGQAQISTTYQFPELQKLASNINSAINRNGGFASENLQQFETDRSIEMQNIVNLIGFAAITVVPETRVISTANDLFMSQIGQTGNWMNLPVEKILDQALKLNIQSLIERVTADPSQMVSDQLEISNNNYDISAQGVFGSKNIAYVVIVFVPKGGG